MTFTGTVDVSVDLSGTLSQPGYATWSADDSQKFNIDVDLSAVLEFDPPTATSSVAPIVLLDRKSITMPAPSGYDGFGQPIRPWTPTASVSTWGRLRLVFESTDVTFLRDTPCQVLSWGSAEPGGDTVMAVEFPQVSPFDQLGTGDRAAIKDGARVYLSVVGGSSKRLFTGEIISPETSASEDSGSLVLHIQGILFTADNSVTPPSMHFEERDIGTVIAETLNGYVSRKYSSCPAVSTGINTRARGAWTPRLSGHVQDLLGQATVANGSNQWTVSNTGLVPSIHLKDITTVHVTVTVGTQGLSFSLAADRTGAPNVIYGQGIAPDGGWWGNLKYPNLRNDDAPLYPLGAGVFTPGSGSTGFAPFAVEMRSNGYTMYSGDTYDSRDEDEVRDAQTRGGITVDGIVGPQTWATVFEVGSNGGDLTAAYFAPLAAKTQVMPYVYNAQGAIIGTNPNYDKSVLRVERFENFGAGVTKQQGVLSARAELLRVADPGIQGTITLKVDPQEFSRFELRAGMNIKLKRYQGSDRLFHIAGVNVDWPSQIVTLDVDTKARDLLTLGAIRARNSDAATDPVRRSLPQRRLSRLTQDHGVIFDAESGAGVIPRHAVYGGLWTVIRIPAGQAGTIAKTTFTTDTPDAKFAVGVFGKPITANHLASLVGNPLTGVKPWSVEADALVDAGIMVAWGGPGQSMGYYPLAESDSGASLTGRFIDDAGWVYESSQPPWLFIAEYSPTTTFISGKLAAAPDFG